MRCIAFVEATLSDEIVFLTVAFLNENTFIVGIFLHIHIHNLERERQCPIVRNKRIAD